MFHFPAAGAPASWVPIPGWVSTPTALLTTNLAALIGS